MREPIVSKILTSKEASTLTFKVQNHYQPTIDMIDKLLIGEVLQITVPIGTKPNILRQTLTALVKHKLSIGCIYKIQGTQLYIKRIL